MRFLLLTFFCLSMLMALGEKPKVISTNSEVQAESIIQDQNNEQKKTADEQYLWIIQNYEQAKHDRYSKSIERALQATDYFIKNYSSDSRLPTVYFYAAQLHKMSGDLAAQEAAITKYFSVATTSNPVYLFARINRAELWESSGKIAEAVKEYENVYAVATENMQVKDSALLHLIPAYEAGQQVEKLKVIYKFFIDHPEKLPNREQYYIYAYKLGVIYYNEGNKKEAAKYFAIVKSGTAPVLKLFKESIETKYK